MYGLRCIEGLSRIAREQIRDRERMRTFEMFMPGRNHANATVLVEAHFERLVRLEKGAHSPQCSINLKVSKLRGIDRLN